MHHERTSWMNGLLYAEELDEVGELTPFSFWDIAYLYNEEFIYGMKSYYRHKYGSIPTEDEMCGVVDRSKK